MAEHGYKQNINCFSKLYDDIFARVYLFYHYDKNYDELQFDVIHSFTPLIFEIDESVSMTEKMIFIKPFVR